MKMQNGKMNLHACQSMPRRFFYVGYLSEIHSTSFNLFRISFHIPPTSILILLLTCVAPPVSSTRRRPPPPAIPPSQANASDKATNTMQTAFCTPSPLGRLPSTPSHARCPASSSLSSLGSTSNRRHHHTPVVVVDKSRRPLLSTTTMTARSSSSSWTFSNMLQKAAKASAVAMAAFVLTSTPVMQAALSRSAPSPPGGESGSPLNAAPLRLTKPQALDEDSERSALHPRWDMHSLDSRTETLLVFANDSSSVIDLWWVDYCGTEVYYASINPGTTHMQPSFASHPWVVRDHISHNSLVFVVATSNPIMAVVKSV